MHVQNVQKYTGTHTPGNQLIPKNMQNLYAALYTEAPLREEDAGCREEER